ncbi:hypothetical protein [Dyella caseinilytica]|uniref:Uncharacterized protein n=1 Tax=Dyella caseinilytica TaxID=1849581 RepID=A0ABX7GXN4_9GAMM|nr:hypothetical protein [Dyella caseinilytica]QRN55255.1 hypothetical protein ISN74_07970 [Dyella caseinilytica]GGA00477.1 hypothetical protein GCM10011408_21730 [Dyella caseinilytica]
MATTQTPTIVNETTVVTVAPTPSQLQQSGAAVSAGGTTLATGTYTYIAEESQLAAILPAPLTLTSLTWASEVVTATAAGAIGLSTGQTFTVTIAGAVPTGYNGTYTATVTGTDTFTFPLTVNPGSETSPGTYTAPYVGFLQNAATTFFAQSNSSGSPIGFYVLEIGEESTASAAITALQAWITANTPQQFYAYLVPASWDSAALNTMTGNYSSPSGQTYFFPTTTVSNLSFYAANKAVIATVPSPTQASTEHQAAVPFYNWLVNNPSASNKLAPMAYRFAFGVTPWVQQGNATNFQNILTAFGTYVGTGAEGGISNACLFRAQTMDGSQSNWWYGVDWFRIQSKQALAAAVINGSNQNPPLEYDQPGINSLLSVLQNVANSAVQFGCDLSVTVTAQTFAAYTTANPDNYQAGIYGGFAATVVGQNGFLTLTFNIDAVQFVA